MQSERLPTQLWVDALIRRGQVAGVGIYVIQKGDPSRGDVLVKVANMRGQAHLYRPRTTMEGARIFIDLSATSVGEVEAEIDAYIARERRFDSDLWVIEIEDPAFRHFLTESIEK